MKRFLAGLSAAVLLGLASLASAGATASYCGTSAYDVHYRAIFEYPTGSYWQNQIANYPAYYAAHNAFYQAKYGC